MRVLLAVDRSPASDAAIEHLAQRALPPGVEVEVLTVVNSPTPAVPDPAVAFVAARVEDIRRQRSDAPDLLRSAADRIRLVSPDIRVTWKVLEGRPKDRIVQEAADWGADVIVLGSRGRAPIGQTLFSSTAMSVAVSAGCLVEIIESPLE